MIQLTLSEQMLSVIAEALANHRFRDAAPVIGEIQKQINAQMPRPPAGNGADLPASPPN